jgi:hypothetical protein
MAAADLHAHLPPGKIGWVELNHIDADVSRSLA